MDKQDEKSLKKILEASTKISESEVFTEEEKESFSKVADQAAGTLLSSWLPSGWVRKILMLAIAFIILFGLSKGQYYYLLLIFLLAMFSPRVVGEIAMFLGRLKGNE